jgi:hypothetical protein
MRPLPRRRNLVVWSQSASSVGRYDTPPSTRTRRIRRWIRTLALLTVVGLMPLARGGRARWLTLLAGVVLTVAGVMLRGGPGGVIFFPGLLLLPLAALIPAGPKADRMRRVELEREVALTGFSHPAQRRLASQAMALRDHRFPAI